MKILEYFRIQPKLRAKFLAENYTKEMNELVDLKKSQAFKDFVSILYLELGSRPDTEEFIKKMDSTLTEVSSQLSRPKTAKKKAKK